MKCYPGRRVATLSLDFGGGWGCSQSVLEAIHLCGGRQILVSDFGLVVIKKVEEATLNVNRTQLSGDVKLLV